MDCASLQFVLFGLAIAIVSNFSRSQLWRSTILMVASLGFLYTLAQSPILFLPLAGFLLLGYIGLALIKHGFSRFLTVFVILVVLAYVWLKKYTFLPEAIFLHHPYFTLGLSYIFFRVLHLLIETGDGDEKRQINIGTYLLYTLNFTTFVSGPIQRYDDFARDQFASQPIALGPRVIGLQLERIIRGFFKVNVLAMLIEAVRQDALAQMSQPLPIALKMFSAFRLAILYPFFIYCNFSGYIDIVIAIARLMRIELPENFDRPFSAPSFLEFWNRWHMTLSNWLKNYVYNPLLLALMRRISSSTIQSYLGVFCFFITFFLIGIWHGRTSEYAVYGAVLGIGAAINKLWQTALQSRLGRKGYRSLAAKFIYIALGRGLTFTYFAFSLFFFWADWKQMGTIFSAIGPMQWLGVWVAIWFSASVVLSAYEWLRERLLSIQVGGAPALTSRYARVVYASALAIGSLVLTLLLNQPAPDIVYKAF